MNREQTTLRLPVELMEKLRGQAEARGMSLNERIVDLILKGFRFEESR